jgi:hypothetical protein
MSEGRVEAGSSNAQGILFHLTSFLDGHFVHRPLFKIELISIALPGQPSHIQAFFKCFTDTTTICPRQTLHNTVSILITKFYIRF